MGWDELTPVSFLASTVCMYMCTCTDRDLVSWTHPQHGPRTQEKGSHPTVTITHKQRLPTAHVTAMGHAQRVAGRNCSGSVTLDPEDTPVTGGCDHWEPPFTCVACASLTARRSGWLLSASVDVKETSNVQCGLADWKFNAGSRVQLEETQESSSRGSHKPPKHPLLAATRDRAQIYRWTYPAKEIWALRS